MLSCNFSVCSKSLPDPSGPLSSEVRPVAIESANRKVLDILSSLKVTTSSVTSDESKVSRGSYMKFTPQRKAQVAKYAIECGNRRAIQRYSKEFGVEIKESTVRSWKQKYIEERRKRSPSKVVEEILSCKRGYPLLLGEDLDVEVKAYVESIRSLGGFVNTDIILSNAQGIISSKDRTLLNALAPGRPWGKSLLMRMGFVKRKGTTKEKITIENLSQQRSFWMIYIQ